MTVKRRSLAEVRHLGYEVLARELGPADFIRFIQQFETGSGDYTEERRRWLDPLDAATLIARIEQRRAGHSQGHVGDAEEALGHPEGSVPTG